MNGKFHSHREEELFMKTVTIKLANKAKKRDYVMYQREDIAVILTDIETYCQAVRHYLSPEVGKLLSDIYNVLGDHSRKL